MAINSGLKDLEKKKNQQNNHRIDPSTLIHPNCTKKFLHYFNQYIQKKLKKKILKWLNKSNKKIQDIIKKNESIDVSYKK